MNKYQESLDNLIRVSCPRKVSCKECDFEKLCNSQAKGYVDTIQELVDRDTPKKPIKDEPSRIRYVPTYVCPSCGQRFSGWESKFCYHCGQKLDLSDDYS